MPLTTVNKHFDGTRIFYRQENHGSDALIFVSIEALRRWKIDRGRDPFTTLPKFDTGMACEHYVVLNKRDLMPAWGVEVQSLAQNMANVTDNSILAVTPGVEEVSPIQADLLYLYLNEGGAKGAEEKSRQ